MVDEGEHPGYKSKKAKKMDAKTTALEIFKNLNNERIENGEMPIQSMFISLASNGENTEDWYVGEKYIHVIGRSPRNEDDGIIPALEDYLDISMAIYDSVQGEILTVRNVFGTPTVRSNVLVLRPRE